METTTWFLIITAIAIPVGNAVFAGILGLIGAHIGRESTKYAANLQALQRRRDIQIGQLERARDDLMTAATAVQSYVWYVDKSIRLRSTITPEEWEDSRESVEPAVLGAQRLRSIAPTLPSESLRDAFVAVERLIMAVVTGSDDPDAPDAWHVATTNQPDPITRAMSAVANEIKRLYDTYPGGNPEANA